MHNEVTVIAEDAKSRMLISHYYRVAEEKSFEEIIAFTLPCGRSPISQFFLTISSLISPIDCYYFDDNWCRFSDYSMEYVIEVICSRSYWGAI